MTAPELKQCPFCDGHAIGNIGVHRPYIYCECCDVHGPSYDTIEEAITAWNRRADLAAIPAQVKVKPLVWDEPRDANNWVNIARSVFGDYYISIDGGRHSAWLEANVEPYENKIGDDVGSVIEAMMLAERDYEAKTRTLIIEPQPDPRDEVIARLVEALRYYADPVNGENGWCANASVARSALAAVKGGVA